MSSLSRQQIRMALEAAGARYIKEEATEGGNYLFVFEGNEFRFIVLLEGRQSDGSYMALLAVAMFSGDVPVTVANDLNSKFFFNRAYITHDGLMIERGIPLNRASAYQVGLAVVLFMNEVERYVI